MPAILLQTRILKNLITHLEKFRDEVFIMGGDFNVGPYPQDIYLKGYDGIAGSQKERDAIAKIRDAGYKDMLENEGYTWWSYANADSRKTMDFVWISFT